MPVRSATGSLECWQTLYLLPSPLFADVGWYYYTRSIPFVNQSLVKVDNRHWGSISTSVETKKLE